MLRRRDSCWRWPIAGPIRESDWIVLLIAEEQSEKAERDEVREASTDTEIPRSSW